MWTTIDAAGRVVIPKVLRQALGLSGGANVEISEHDGTIEIVPAATPMALVGEGADIAAFPDHPLPPLTDTVVRDTIDRLRR